MTMSNVSRVKPEQTSTKSRLRANFRSWNRPSRLANTASNASRTLLFCVGCATLLLIVNCGGSNSSSRFFNTSQNQSWEPGVFVDQNALANRCDLPRSGSDTNGNAYPDISGTALQEKLWLRSWSNDFYLWYSEIEDVDPSPFSILDYFDQLKTNELTELGAVKDNFHFSADTETYQQSQSGISSGYGMDIVFERTSNTSITILVADTEENTPASDNNIARGTQILFTDNVDMNNFSNADIDTINAALFPNNINQSHTFIVQDANSDTPRTVTMSSTVITKDPVKFVTTFDIPGSTTNSTAGYLLFNTHNEISEQELYDAITELESQNVSELILDVRYNGGGLLAIASQLSYMIAGRERTEGRTFERLAFNDKYPTTNPITGQTISPIPFFSTGVGFSLQAATPLPSLDLNRVFMITTADSCSASEAIINSLRGINVEVILIGSQTCGKPYGFYPQDNCGTTYFTIQFQGVNDKGFGDYPNGFSPNDNLLITNAVPVPGCSTEDDFDHFLGTVEETNIASALHYMQNGSCPSSEASEASSKLNASSLQKPFRENNSRLMNIPEWQKNRILITPRH